MPDEVKSTSAYDSAYDSVGRNITFLQIDVKRIIVAAIPNKDQSRAVKELISERFDHFSSVLESELRALLVSIPASK